MTLGPIEFTQPMMLLALVVLAPVVVLLSRKGLSGSGKSSRVAAVAARLLACTLLVAALARATHNDEAQSVSVTVINDVSRSIPTSVQPRIDDYVSRAQDDTREPDDRLGVITAARDPIIQSAPSRIVTSIERQFIGDTEATNLAAAVTQAIASAPKDAATRIVLITDANETEGSLYRAAQQARAAGIPIDVLPVEFEYEQEVMVESVSAPSSARVGETLAIRVVITSTVPAAGRLMLSRSGTPIDLDPAPDQLGYYTELKKGRNVVRVPVEVRTPGPQLYDAVFEPITALDESGTALASVGDSVRENNSGSVITFVADKGRVLLVAEDAIESQRLEEALASAEIIAQRVTSATMPTSLPELASYEAIIMVNQSAYNHAPQTQELLRQYVHDLGGGLVMIGGPDAFGAGGWIGSPLADALPIQLDPPQRRQMPLGALAIVLDSSGSMGATISGTNMTQMTAATEASVAAIDALSRLDQVAVVAFSGQARVVVPLMKVSDKAGITRRLRSINAGGGTNMYPGIEEGWAQLERSNAGLKHIIVLSDGQTSGSPRAGTNIARRIAANGATISTVAIGDGADQRLLRTIAQSGKGRFYKVSAGAGLANLPQIFVKEAQTVRRALIWEGEPFSPARTGIPSDTMRGISSVPPISGYIVAAERDGLSLVTLRGKEEDPVAALWQYGLGKSVAFTSGASTRWAPSWAAWDGYDQFWTQHIRWAMRPGGDASLRVSTSNDGDRTTVVVDAFKPDGERLDFASFRARASSDQGDTQTLELRQVGPGRYEASFDSSKPGSYVVSMLYRAPGQDGQVLEGSAQAAVVRPFADEFRSLRTNLPLLRRVASITGGRVLSSDPTQASLWTREGLEMPVTRTPIWQALLIAAIAIFLIDVAVRRVRFEPAAMFAFARRGVAKETDRSEGAMDAMRRVRARGSETDAQPKKKQPKRAAPGTAAASAIPLSGDAPPPIEHVKPREQPKERTPDEAADALSALRAAKKRARDEFNNDD